MVKRTETRFAGYDCVKLENEALALWISRSVGPRLLGLALNGGENLFAVLPHDQTECPGVGLFSETRFLATDTEVSARIM